MTEVVRSWSLSLRLCPLHPTGLKALLLCGFAHDFSPQEGDVESGPPGPVSDLRLLQGNAQGLHADGQREHVPDSHRFASA